MLKTESSKFRANIPNDSHSSLRLSIETLGRLILSFGSSSIFHIFLHVV